MKDKNLVVSRTHHDYRLIMVLNLVVLHFNFVSVHNEGARLSYRHSFKSLNLVFFAELFRQLRRFLYLVVLFASIVNLELEDSMAVLDKELSIRLEYY